MPLVAETFLSTTIGFVGMMMVASEGEAAVSGVSLVDNVNNLILYFLAALATGGAIIIAQYLGKGDRKKARDAAKQLLYTAVLAALAFMLIALAGNKLLLSLIFGEISPDVMQNARIYFFITAASYPFIAIINSVSATFRSMGMSKTPMLAALMMSVINMCACAVLIYVFRMGVAGAATAALLSRAAAAAAMLHLVRDRHNAVFLERVFAVRIKPKTMKHILKVGIPSGLDQGMFHLGRLIMQGLIATFGTVAIAANAVVGQISNIVFIPGTAVSMAIITVVGQCVGANDCKQAVLYGKRLIKYVCIVTAVLCAGTYLLRWPLLGLFNLSVETGALSSEVLSYTLLFTTLLHTLSFTLPNVLRAAGDVRFTMVVSIASMWLVRICMSYALEHTLSLGLMSVWFSMYADWFVRSAVFMWRFLSGKWEEKRVI